MPPTFPNKFVRASLRLFSSEGHFLILIPREMDLEDVAQEYESYGHRVERDGHRHELNVICAGLPQEGTASWPHRA